MRLLWNSCIDKISPFQFSFRISWLDISTTSFNWPVRIFLNGPLEFSWPQSLQSRSRQNQPPEVFYKKGVLKNFTKFTESLFFNKVAGLRPETLLKKSVWHRCFHVNFAKILRTRFLQNTSGRLLLSRHGPDKLEVFELLKSVLIYYFRMSSQRCNLNMCSSTVYLVPRFFTIVVKKLLNSSATFFIFREKEFCFELKYVDGEGG